MMDGQTQKWVIIGALVVLIVYWLSQRSGGGTITTSPAQSDATTQSQIAAQSQAFGEITATVGNVLAAREQTAQANTLAANQLAIENIRANAAVQGLTIQANAQNHAADTAASASKTKSVLDSIPVIGSILSLF